MGTPFLFSLAGSSLGKGAPVRVPPAGGPRPTRPSGLRADTLPTLSGGCAAARPVKPPAGSSRGNVRPKAGQARPGQVGPQPLHGGTPPQCKAKPLRGGPKARPCIAPPPCRLRRRCSGAARPPRVGAVGPSAPPARSAALRPALPARPRLRRRPCRSALPTHSPPGVAARGPSLGVPPPSRAGAPAAGCCCSPCPCGGPQSTRRPLGPRKRGLCPLCGRLGRGERRLRAGVPPGSPAGKAKASPAQGGKPPTGGGLACQRTGQRGQLWRVSRPLAGLPPAFHSGVLGGASCVVCCRLSCVWLWSCLVAGLPSWWCLWLVAVPVCQVGLAVLSGGGFCLSAGGGVPWAFLACWCCCRSAGSGALQIKSPPVDKAGGLFLSAPQHQPQGQEQQ